MLNPDTVRKIELFVYLKPRSINEIAMHIGKNWRTADRYIEEIEKDLGTVSTRVFRGGTRGALKIAYWSSAEKASSNVFQEKLEQDIMKSKRKEDFSAFDIFQHVPEKNRDVTVCSKESENMDDFIRILLSAKKQVLIFSGNLSMVNIRHDKRDFIDIFRELVKRKVTIKVLSRVDIAGKENIEKLFSLNFRQGAERIEIRHDVHALRGVIIDNKVVRLKEVSEPTGKINELNKKAFIFYTVNDKSWAECLSKVFWRKFSNSIDARRRLEHLNGIKI